MNFKTLKLGDICDIKIGRTPPRKQNEWFNVNKEYYKWISIKDMGNSGKYIYHTTENISNAGIKKFNIPIVPKDTVILSFKLTLGRVCITGEDMITNEAIAQLPIKNNTVVNNEYLYYYLTNYEYSALGNTSSIATAVNSKILKNIILRLPEMDKQKKVVKILRSLDRKIELNNQINNNLHEIINYIYKKSFINLENKKRADEIAEITIGKTPPRNIRECFSNDVKDMKWISISDLGKCGTFIFDTNEKLTLDAVKKYNVKIIPKETLILSFKLTVGRIAITTEKMATNEAIAHFNLYDDKIKYYLYSYLKNFDYGKLGSTSSIATAVNSKIIKAMPIYIPNEEQLKKYNQEIIPIFKKIRSNEMENKILEQLRDILLPKLMNGEINLDKVEL